jgi:hypothetical protein
MSDGMGEESKVNHVYSFVVVPDNGDPPISGDTENLDAFKRELYSLLLRTGAGWCYPKIDGTPLQLSTPVQTFHLKASNGVSFELPESTELVWENDNRFRTLIDRPRSD